MERMFRNWSDEQLAAEIALAQEDVWVNYMRPLDSPETQRYIYLRAEQKYREMVREAEAKFMAIVKKELEKQP